MSRLADSGDLRLQIQNICGISANQLKLCRVEEVVAEKNEGIMKTVVSSVMTITPLTDKDGPCSSLVKKRAPGDDSTAPITQIVAFEMTLRPRSMPPPAPKKEEIEALEDTADEEDETDFDDDHILPTPREQALIKRYLDVYGDEKECRLMDTNPVIIAKAVSRSLWPKTAKELKLGLRVDARDHRGNWFPGNVVEIVEDEVNGGDADTGEAVAIHTKRVRVHFDNFSTKWDEMYSIDHFLSGGVRPLYSHAAPRPKPIEIIVQNRHTDRNTGQSVVFGQTYYVQCMNDWSNARAGAHILAQASRFLRYDAEEWSTNVANSDPEHEDQYRMVRRLYEKTQTTISDLIDLLVDCDREYVLLALGLSEHNKEEEKRQPFRNSSFDPTQLSSLVIKKVSALLARLPFELRVCATDIATAADGNKVNASPSSASSSGASEEILFPFSLIRTIGNYLNARHVIVLHWKEPPVDKKTGVTKYSLEAPVMYVAPRVEVDKISAEVLDKAVSRSASNSTNATSGGGVARGGGGSGGVDLGVCLTEFCKVQNLSLADNWKCPKCKKFREGRQSMTLWRLPDLLTFHIKRFNMSARWREKITTKVNFPLTGLDMSEWCHAETSNDASGAPPVSEDHALSPSPSYVYDLIGVMNHYGSMTGGHYVAMCKATTCGREGREAVAHQFNGLGAQDDVLSLLLPSSAACQNVAGVSSELLTDLLSDELASSSPPQSATMTVASGWRGALGRGFPNKAASGDSPSTSGVGPSSSSAAVMLTSLASSPSHAAAAAAHALLSSSSANVSLNTPGKISAALAAQAMCESSEPLWLQFDDELVEPVPPRGVVTESAYVLFYRRREMTPSNLTKYSTLAE
jgi:hypothetical protein